MSVSLCVLRFELTEDNYNVDEIQQQTLTNWDKRKIMSARGCRKSRELKIETYGSADELIDENLKKKDFIKKSKSNSLKKKNKLKKEQSTMSKTEKINFISGNPFVEVTKGVLHVYKENILTPVDKASNRSQMVCILSVPSNMNCHDLMTFIAACQENIHHIRIIRDAISLNQYMTLISFRTQEATMDFFHSFNGMPFNSLEPDCCCNLVFVSKIEVIKEDQPGCSAPPSQHTELPVCAVCLERMDESVDGILTILCNHSFHGNCLTKWGDTSCPVCRYVQTPESVPDNQCQECHSSESLWICLICGYVGCGRYVQGHAYNHYLETSHCYSMNLGNNRVWDYVGDNFVHRLVQNKGDGKLVEGSNPGKLDDTDQKLESIQLEFTYLLTTQLESQRKFFENQMKQFEENNYAQVSKIQSKANAATEENKKLKKIIHGTNKDSDILEKKVEENKNLLERINTINKEKLNLEKKINNLNIKLEQTKSKLDEESQINFALQKNQVEWQVKFSQLEKEFTNYKTVKDQEITELKEQVRDLMFFLEAQNTIDKSDCREDILNGSLIVDDQNTKAGSSKSRNHKKQR
ncbi:BRCA1-associated protein-like isoform X1 [Daktulosphaira vitifoliae]|uniref:BRCA1-associated protein-like isoform X1 n=1 Tax=Daktulosphaira vitifoliae TaxID=58002 RepID=UPI0021AA1C41|nr:BRCA1-associated protein-like isoform X1 [Daktulosphaira vitifoliae]XP_050544736.1 BRCA1-associated protein-like isoform X1 [Daktulosphaira vitifoliae]